MKFLLFLEQPFIQKKSTLFNKKIIKIVLFLNLCATLYTKAASKALVVAPTVSSALQALTPLRILPLALVGLIISYCKPRLTQAEITSNKITFQRNDFQPTIREIEWHRASPPHSCLKPFQGIHSFYTSVEK